MIKPRKKGLSPMDMALKYLDIKPRTVREVEIKLDESEIGEQEVDDVIARLKELNFLNDSDYAANFIRTRLACKPVSRRKLRDQLYNHKLPKDIIEDALLTVSEDTEKQNALNVAKKFYAQFSALEEYPRAMRVAKRLASRGFDYSVIAYALGQMNCECDEAMLEGETEGDEE
jgi:regulatory protein